jgi:Uncharacterized protein conserved in bacteria (DUF2252)
MNIAKVVDHYERWLRQRMPLIADDLRLKHKKMAQSPFMLLRGAFFRWAEVWPQICDDLASAPVVLGIGDVHVENFGTWRDAEGRLAWGVNDFDEAAVLPYTSDLVRLCTSALLAIDKGGLTISQSRACEAVLVGYRSSLTARGEPIVLAERHPWLRDIAALGSVKEREYWDKLHRLEPVPLGSLPPRVRLLLNRAMPDTSLQVRVVHRIGGLGSLGRQRFTAIAQWRGGYLAREAKPLTASAWHWLKPSPGRVRYSEIVESSVRDQDPFLRVRDGWIIRRLAPDCGRIDLEQLPKKKDAENLLQEMGWETANVHLGTPSHREAILKDLRRRDARWLLKAARQMAACTVEDWRTWRRSKNK